MDKKLTVSASPHVRSQKTSAGIMLDVIIALVPALIASVVIFGFRALAVTAVCVASSVLGEFVTRKILKRSVTVGDLSAVVTGLLLAFNLPVTIPLWMAAVGALFAIVVVKQFFGGIGQNFVNPAIAGRIVLLVSFPSAMSHWTGAFAWKSGSVTDAVTTATPLRVISEGADLPSLADMFLGKRAGCIGETCILALLIGFVYLLVRKIIKPVIPLCFIGTVAVIMLIAGKGDIEYMAYELLSGGLFLGAIFMATDYTTSPVSLKGKIIFAVGCGLITSVIRLFGSLPEGVSYSIIIMNIVTPLIDRWTMPEPFGTVKEKEEKTA